MSEDIKNYKFHSTGQFRNAVKNVQNKAKFKGLDGEGNAIIDETAIAPTLSYTGTVKLHGTNASIIIHSRGLITFNSKSQTLAKMERGEFTLFSDNAEFAQSMSRRSAAVNQVCILAEQACDKKYGDVVYPIKISGEWCGCFHYNTPIRLADGTTEKIGVIVNKKLPVEVLSYNQDTHKVEAKKVTSWFNNGVTDKWLTLSYKRRGRGGKGLGLTVTPNHNIFTKKGNRLVEIPAGTLKVGDTVFMRGRRLSHKANQFIRGSLLGDMSFDTKRTVSVGHSKDNQPEYIPFISTLIDGRVSQKKSGYGSNMEVFLSRAYPEIEDLYAQLNTEVGKNPTERYLDGLGVIGLAAWYMDDGSLINRGGNRQPQCELHTLGFSVETNVMIAEWLTKRGYPAYTIDRNRYNRPSNEIRLTIEGAAAFLEDIAPYILSAFNYKLPEKLTVIPKIDITKVYSDYEEPLVETTITSIEEGIGFKDKTQKSKYDIEVEGNHNYFANNILVHNSGIQKGVGISFLDKKSLFVFGVKINEEWLPLEDINNISCDEGNIFNITDFPTKHIDIDFSNPVFSQNKLVHYTEEVEKECPVAKQLKIEESLLGEGLVWIPDNPELASDSGNWFKTKGEKHSVSKVKSVAAVCPEKLSSIQSFVDYACTDNRMQQGVGEVGLDQKNIGAFVGWVNKDINKEEGDVLEENNLSMKDVGKYTANKARTYFISKLNNLEG